MVKHLYGNFLWPKAVVFDDLQVTFSRPACGCTATYDPPIALGIGNVAMMAFWCCADCKV